MKPILQASLAAALVALAAAAPVRANAAEPANANAHDPTHTAQAEKRVVVECTHDKDAKGASAKEDCEARPAREPQTHKMVRCNEEAGRKQLHGDERRAFMSSCLKG